MKLPFLSNNKQFKSTFVRSEQNKKAFFDVNSVKIFPCIYLQKNFSHGDSIDFSVFYAISEDVNYRIIKHNYFLKFKHKIP